MGGWHGLGGWLVVGGGVELEWDAGSLGQSSCDTEATGPFGVSAGCPRGRQVGKRGRVYLRVYGVCATVHKKFVCYDTLL